MAEGQAGSSDCSRRGSISIVRRDPSLVVIVSSDLSSDFSRTDNKGSRTYSPRAKPLPETSEPPSSLQATPFYSLSSSRLPIQYFLPNLSRPASTACGGVTALLPKELGDDNRRSVGSPSNFGCRLEFSKPPPLQLPTRKDPSISKV